jgi:nascent polypeptide-associated complex subunit alpha
MIPGMNMNSRQMKQAMKRMGIQQEEMDAKEVIIILEDKKIVISNPNVSKVNMMGQETYQITGEENIESLETKAEINEDDIKTVMEQTSVSEQEAKAAIEEADGDLAQAIMNLSE